MASRRLTVGSAFFLSAKCIVASCFAVGCFAYGQAFYAEQDVRVRDLPSLTAQSTHAHDVLTTSLEIVFNDKEICCGKNSALGDSVKASDPKSLKDIASKLRGRHLLSDGRPIMITADSLTSDAVNGPLLIQMIRDQHAALMEWNSHVYVLFGVTYVETTESSTGETSYAIHKFLLQDARYSDSRREISFDRLNDDMGKVQGFLFIQAARQ